MLCSPHMSLEQRLWQLRIMLWVMIWLALCVLVSIWSMFAGAAIFGVGGGLLWWLRSTGRGPFARRPPATRPPDDPAQREREARYMVTQLLRNLTRVQVDQVTKARPVHVIVSPDHPEAPFSYDRLGADEATKEGTK